VEIQNSSRRHINVVVREEGLPPWKLTCFYGHPKWTKRHKAWALLTYLKQYNPKAWLVIGNFNEILEQSEKDGRLLRRDAQMDLFRNTLEDCYLSDFGFCGPKFTWVSGRTEGVAIRERLDCAFANCQWCGLHRNAMVNVLVACTYDHNPLLLQFNNVQEHRTRYPRSFKVEASWMIDEEFNDVVREACEAWDTGGTTIHTARLKLANCQKGLKRWNGNKFGTAECDVKRKRMQLAVLQTSSTMDNDEAIKQLQEEINFILEQDDIRWKQRAKQNWYQYGDQNTPFFHAWANHRRRVNQIRVIKDVEGREWKKPEDIGMAFCKFYQELFSAGESGRIAESLQHIEARVTVKMNAMLLKAYTTEEVELALLQMHPLKSSSPDGFAACFYQKSWATMKTEVCVAVLDFLNNGNFDNELNVTHIALILKKKNPSILTDYRPTSLCNVLYKLIAKVIANRLKKVLAIIISLSQSAFVPGRLITDNVLVAFEALCTMDRKLKGREGYMALKLDMSKAYDRVEWNYLEVVMRKLGFDDRWVQLAITCVRTVSFSILING
jgi:hypothetical protein